MIHIRDGSSAPIHTNWFLASLPEKDYQHIQPYLEYVSLKSGETIQEVGEKIRYVYFPVTCLISSLLTTGDGTSMEVQLIGTDGCTGECAVFGRREALTKTVTIFGGDAWRLPVGWFKDEFKHAAALHDFILYHTSSQLAQSHLLSLCHHFHSVEERTARWLLTAADITASNEIPITHEVLAQSVGATRPGVTLALSVLGRAGLIECRRGNITVSSHKKLADCACECYIGIRNEIDNSIQSMMRRSGSDMGQHLASRQGEFLQAKNSDVLQCSDKLRERSEALRQSMATLKGNN